MAEPPFDAGGVKATEAVPFPPVAWPMVGAPGAAAGVTEFDWAEAMPVPAAFVAATVKVYAVPFVRPVTVIGDAVPDAVIPPGDDVTVYPVMADPPFDAGGVKVTVACALPAVAVPMVGVPA